MADVSDQTLVELGKYEQKEDELEGEIDSLKAQLLSIQPAVAWAEHERQADADRITKVRSIKTFITQRLILVVMTPITAAMLGWLLILTHHIPKL